ncbi:Hypothetical protein PHPALM_7755, partial [Phytophthora palmivora]
MERKSSQNRSQSCNPGTAIPASSAQIERDFGNSGQLVTALRASTSPQNIDMACFLYQNRSFVDICQCPKLGVTGLHERGTPER